MKCPRCQLTYTTSRKNLDEFPGSRPYQERLGFRSTLATPLLREGVPLGVILIRRMDVRAFSEAQIKLLETSHTRKQSPRATGSPSRKERR
jgi:hypothetical protein